jgi:hypothetical protein
MAGVEFLSTLELEGKWRAFLRELEVPWLWRESVVARWFFMSTCKKIKGVTIYPSKVNQKLGTRTEWIAASTESGVNGGVRRP